MKNVFCLILLALMTACAQHTIPIKRIPFDKVEFSALEKTGDATVTGQTYIRTDDGKINYPDKGQARLNPKTSYSEQWYKVHYLQRKNIANADPRYLKHVHKADIGAEGQFTFSNIPAGSYYISAPVFWMDEIKLKDGSILLKRQGSFICFEVQVKEGATLITNITQQQSHELAQSR